MEIWQLFIDESGEHVHRRDVNVVTGLLIQEPDQGRLGDVLRPTVSRVYPLVPYPPLAADGGEQLVGGGPEQVLVFARAGARKTLAAHDLTAGRRYDSIYLGREEDWLPGALVSEERVLFAADGGLYLLDRQRELYLSAFEPLDAGSDFAAGGLWANGDALYLLARGALFQFRLR